MRWPPPFRSLEHPAAVFAWGMYDLANQSFQLLINSLLFPIFFTAVIVGDPERGRSLWFRMSAAGLLLVVVLSPIMGAIADQRRCKRELLLMSGIVCALLTLGLGMLQHGQGMLAFGIYLIAAVACGLGENFLGAFLPEISTPRSAGRVSGIGWTMSYIGALLLLGLTALYSLVLDQNDPAMMRPVLIFAGVWFAMGMIPSLLWLHEQPAPNTGTPRTGTLVGASFRRLAQSARESSKYRQLVRFFVAFAVYSAGTLTMIYGLGLIGDRLGFTLDQLILMGSLVAITAGISSAIAGRVQDSFGHVRTLTVFLIIWILATLSMAGAEHLNAQVWVFWLVAGLVGVALGGIGTGSRAIVGAFTPPERAGEFFGLWGMIYKLSGIVGVLLFGELSSQFGQAPALLVVAGLFAVGLLLLRRVNEHEGIELAEAIESKSEE